MKAKLLTVYVKNRMCIQIISIIILNSFEQIQEKQPDASGHEIFCL